jgi:DNA-binding HxlR family transcriptional regulator
MVLLDLLGRRWSLRVLWELRDRSLTSRDLRAACDDVSPTVLQTRLGDLRAADLVGHRAGEGYHLTALGAELMTAFTPLYRFADRWADRPAAPGRAAPDN